MLHLHIDPHSGVPVYRQIMDQTKYYVASGALKPGDQMPSIRELAKALSVNPTTVVKAYGELQHEGVVAMQQGRGVFVAESATRLSVAERRKALQRLARTLAVEATQMGASADEVLDTLRGELERLSDE